MHFTIHQSSLVNSRVLHDLETIRRTLCGRFDCIQSLVLVGGFGRGEGTVQVEGSKVTPVNDYDVVVVSQPRIAASVLAQIGASLANRIGIRFVDLIPYSADQLTQLPPTIFNYDFRYGGYVFHGAPETIHALPDFDEASIPIDDAWTLLCNRLVCLLESFPGIQDDRTDYSDFVLRQASKAVLAACDAMLIQEGAYRVKYSDKVGELEQRRVGSKDCLSVARAALAIKVGSENFSQVSADEYWNAAARVFLPVVSDYLRELTGANTSEWGPLLSSYLACTLPKPSLRRRIRQWIPGFRRRDIKRARRRYLEAAEISFLVRLVDGAQADEMAALNKRFRRVYRRAIRSYSVPNDRLVACRQLVATWYHLNHA